jgi:hypothetical protein
MRSNPLLEFLKGASESHRAGRASNAQQPGGTLGVEVEDDSQGDHLALSRA